jgi:hypothetical protein
VELVANLGDSLKHSNPFLLLDFFEVN